MNFQLVDHESCEIMTMSPPNLSEHDHEITFFHDPDKLDHMIMNNDIIS